MTDPVPNPPTPPSHHRPVHLILGPVGAGKSTYAIAIAKREGAIRLTLDEWMTRLFRPDRPQDDVMRWYVDRAERCTEQIWEVACDAMSANVAVVLEIGLIRREDRERFYGWVDAQAAQLTVHLIDAPREVRRQRVIGRNRTRGLTFAVDVPSEFFELASDLWEPPGQDERERFRFVVPTQAELDVLPRP